MQLNLKRLQQACTRNNMLTCQALVKNNACVTITGLGRTMYTWHWAAKWFLTFIQLLLNNGRFWPTIFGVKRWPKCGSGRLKLIHQRDGSALLYGIRFVLLSYSVLFSCWRRHALMHVGLFSAVYAVTILYMRTSARERKDSQCYPLVDKYAEP